MSGIDMSTNMTLPATQIARAINCVMKFPRRLSASHPPHNAALQ